VSGACGQVLGWAVVACQHTDPCGLPTATPASLSGPNTTFKIPQADSDPADGPTPDDRPRPPDSTSGRPLLGQQDKADPEDWRTKAAPHQSGSRGEAKLVPLVGRQNCVAALPL